MIIESETDNRARTLMDLRYIVKRHGGSVTPTATHLSANEQPCREFTTTVNIGGQPQQGYGTACRQADGSWKIQQG